MSTAHEPQRESAGEPWAGRERLIGWFESAWGRGERPAIAEHLPAEAGERRVILIELAHAELECRLKAGEAARAEDYLARFPELRQDPEAALDLIAREYALRQRREPALGSDEYLHRFPEYRDRLPERLPTQQGCLPAPDLLDALRKHHLLDPARLEEFAANLPSPLPEARALAEDLIGRGWLTPYQVEQLLLGRGQNLVLGPYVLLERLGEGGMGAVYKARHRPMDRVVALKIIRPERLAQADALQRFRREIRALAQLSHPNIVTAYHADCVGDASFLVMEYVEGTDLHQFVRDSGPLAVGQACDYVRQSAPDPAALEKDADAAIAQEKEYWGGHSLKGLALLVRSRRESDYRQKLAALREADRSFAMAVKFSATEKNQEELSTLYRYWSSACLERGHYALTDRKERDASIQSAEAHAREATQFNQRNLDAWDALAFALEDAGFVLNQPQKYQAAKKAYDQAILLSFRDDRVLSWLGRGRALYRWGLAIKDETMMKDALDDLGEVTRRSPESLEAAEAHYWKACVELFRRGRAKVAQDREDLLKRAEEGLGASLKLARANKSAEWEEAALTAWANLALTEAQDRKRGGAPGGPLYLKRAKELARDLARFNAPEAAYLRGQAIFAETGNKSLALAAFLKEGKKPRDQDKRSLVNLYVNRTLLRLTMNDADLNSALADAQAAEREATEADLDPGIRGFASGTLGLSLYLSATQASGEKRASLRDQALTKFRAGVKLAPEHSESYIWYWLIADILNARGNLTAAERREARESIAEARRRMPAGSPYRSQLEKLYKKYSPE
jgi:hypothetical protein